MRRSARVSSALLCAMLAVATAVSVYASATIVIQNNDGGGEGFNDLTPFTPVGGNPATTLGQARLNAFQYAADLWAVCLNSPVTITVQAQMDPQFCDATSAVLGSAGTTTVHANFTGAPTNVWYPQALANSIAGVDLSASPDISATFNSNLNGNPACLGGIGWYYGFDGMSGGDIDFVTVVFHEIGHGLGFQTFMASNGVLFSGLPDTYLNNLYCEGNSPPDYPSMNNPQRASCNVGDPDLVWDGAAVTTLGNAILSGGLNNGRVRMHAPNPYQNGSSVSHWSPALLPNEFMEPFYAGPNHELGLGIKLMEDIGWSVGAATVLVTSTGTNVGFSFPLLEARIELSDIGSNTAYNVQGTLSGGPAWLNITDANCSYGTIAPSQSSNGAPDSYELDLTDWPGGSFTVDVNVTWQDECGIDRNVVLQKTFDDVLTSVPGYVPDRYSLAQNFPNPFNPTTEIEYELKQGGTVELAVFDVAGNRIRTLVSGARPSGPNTVLWDGRDNSGRTVSSGVYFYRIEAGQFTATKRMVLLK